MTDINFKMSNSDKILNNQMLSGESLFFMGQEMVIDLIVFDMFILDIILGMNFLGWYGAEI